MPQKPLLALILTAALLDGSCFQTPVRHPVSEFLEHDRIVMQPRAEAYVTKDGVEHPIAHGAILRFRPDGGASITSDRLEDVPGTPFSKHLTDELPPGEVVAIVIREVTGKDVVMSILLPIGIFVALVAVAVAAKQSCPFIYSWDGEKYVFDGEPYGGATIKTFERTDFSELEHLREMDGRYQLLLTNEVDETQHTDSLALVAADYAPGSRIVVEPGGEVHAFRRWLSLTSAQDGSGHDIRSLLATADKASWYPDLNALSAHLPLADTRDHISLGFDRPRGTNKVWLVVNAGTGLWGSRMIRTMLGMRGNKLQEFYDAVNASAFYKTQIEAWNDREEIFHLGVQLQVGDRWERRAVIPGGGPFVTETRAIPIDLTGVSGDEVHIRIHPPVGFWNLNSFELAWDDAPVKTTTLSVESAMDENNSNVRATLLADDGMYLDMPNTANVTRLSFRAPPRTPDLNRVVFARTRGFYELHLDPKGPPDEGGLRSLATEPGYIVQRAMREFATLKRTGTFADAAGR